MIDNLSYLKLPNSLNNIKNLEHKFHVFVRKMLIDNQ